MPTKPKETCFQTCSGCALTKGAAANLEPKNHLTAQICVFGPVPFYCHGNIDWRKQKSNISRAEYKEKGFRLCGGWVREVQQLAETGYYKDNPVVTKIYAQLAIQELNYLCSEAAKEDPEEKEEAKRRLSDLVKALNKKWNKFQKVKTGVIYGTARN